MRKTRKRLLLISIPVLICAAVLTFFIVRPVKGIDGNEWLIKQEEYMDDLQLFAEEMDEVYTLYLIGSISAEDFGSEVSVLKKEYAILDAVYKQEEKEHPILPESYSYAAQKGVEGIRAARQTFQNILNESMLPDGSVPSQEQISYIYLSYRQELNQHLAVYITAYQAIAQAPDSSGASNEGGQS